MVQLPPEAQGPAGCSKYTDDGVLAAATRGKPSEQACTAEPPASDRMFVPVEDMAGTSPLMDVRPKALLVVYYKQDCGELTEVSAKQSCVTSNFSNEWNMLLM